MVSFRDYEIYLLFLLLVKFHGSGKCEIYSPAQRILRCLLLPGAILSLDIENANPFFFRQNDFRTPRWLSTIFCISKLRYDLEFQSRDR